MRRTRFRARQIRGNGDTFEWPVADAQAESILDGRVVVFRHKGGFSTSEASSIINKMAKALPDGTVMMFGEPEDGLFELIEMDAGEYLPPEPPVAIRTPWRPSLAFMLSRWLKYMKRPKEEPARLECRCTCCEYRRAAVDKERESAE